jgi:hypothetical protein
MGIIQSAMAGLFIGIGTYYITKLFFDPIIRYKETIYEIDKNLIYYANAKYYETDGDGNYDKSDSPYNQRLKKGKDIHRQSAGKLRAAYCHLPRAYKRFIACKGVNPFSSSRDLIGLSNSNDRPKDMRYESEDRIRKHLKLFDPETGELMSFKPGEK